MLFPEFIEKLIRAIDAVVDAIAPPPPELIPVPVRQPRREPK